MRKNKAFEDEHDDIDFEIDDRTMKEIAAAERLGVLDFIIAGIVAAGVYLLQTLWAFPTIPPATLYAVMVESSTSLLLMTALANPAIPPTSSPSSVKS